MDRHERRSVTCPILSRQDWSASSMNRLLRTNDRIRSKPTIKFGRTPRSWPWLANFNLDIHHTSKYSDSISNTSGALPGSGNRVYRLAVSDGCWDFKRNNQYL